MVVATDRSDEASHARVTHYVVVGAGAIGRYLGGSLAWAGEQVTLVGRPGVVDNLRNKGLSLSDLDGGSMHVEPQAFKAVSDCNQVLADNADPGDICVLLCVKGGATARAAREIFEAFGGATPVVSCQNGIENVARILSESPSLNAIAAMVPFNVVCADDGQVRRTTSGVLKIATSPTAARLVEALTAARIPAQMEGDMPAVQWGKLLLNLNNPVNALSDLPLRDQLAERPYRLCLAALQREALAALRKAGIKPAKVGAISPEWMPLVLRAPDLVFRLVAGRMQRIDPAARSSMWDDLQAGRPTEIDDFCGAVVRLGGQVGVPTPCNSRMLELMHQHRPGESYDGHALRKRLRA